MAFHEYRVGNQNKLIPQDIKVGMALTAILFEASINTVKPVAKVYGGRALRNIPNTRLRR